MKFGLSIQSYEKIKKVIDKYNQYVFYVFGSRARGDYKANSDIDIVIMSKINEKSKFNIRNDFDLLDIPYMVDLVFIQDVTKEDFLKSIKRDGVKFYE